ncbi:MAG: Gfo/Idh/MocA family oxidoreductase [Dehalococcoidia bacterium]
MTTGNRRVGIIGAGFGTMVHAPGFKSEGWDVAALFSRNEGRARKAADAAGVPDIYTNAMELIERDDLDAIAIATPPGQHHELSIAALRSGKHVLCEKPFAINSHQAAEMQAVAEETGLTAMVAHEFRHTPQRAYIKGLLNSGYVGEFKMCTIELFFNRGVPKTPPPVTWAARKSEGGGFLGALGSHYIDGLRYWFGDVTTAAGRVETFRPDLTEPATGEVVKSETDDAFSFTLTFKDGGTATMSASSALAPSRGARIAVMGLDGTLYAEQDGPNPAEDGVVLGGQNGEPIKKLDSPAGLMPFSDDRDPRLMAFRLLVRDFNRGIDEGTSPAPNFTDGFRCQQVLDAIRESSETGRTIAIS